MISLLLCSTLAAAPQGFSASGTPFQAATPSILRSAQGHVEATFETDSGPLQFSLAPDLSIPQPTVLTDGPDGPTVIPHSPYAFLRGTMTGHEAARVAAFEVRGKFHVAVLDEAVGNLMHIAPDALAPDTYSVTVQRAGERSGPVLGCACNHGPSSALPTPLTSLPSTSSGAPRLLSVGLDSDYEFCDHVGGTEAEIGAYMAGILHLAGLVHEAYLGVKPFSQTIWVRKRPAGGATDPNYTYTLPLFSSGLNTPYFALVRNQWLPQATIPQVIELLTGKPHSSIGGIAKIGRVCVPDYPTLSNRVSWSRLPGPGELSFIVNALTHEMGHQLSLEHNVTETSVMQPTLPGPLVFSPAERIQVLSHLDSYVNPCAPDTGTLNPAPTVTSNWIQTMVTEADLQPSPHVTLEPVVRFCELEIQGTDLNFVHEFSFDGQTIYSDSIRYQSPQSITLLIDADEVGSAGTKALTVTSTGGSASFLVDFVAPTSSQIDGAAAIEVGFPWGSVRTALSSRAGATLYLSYNLTGTLVPRGPHTVLSGAQVAGPFVTDSLGLTHAVIASQVAGVMVGDTLYLQATGIGPLPTDYDVTGVTAVCYCP